MKKYLLFILISLALLGSCKKENPKVEIITYKGTIVLELDLENAAVTANNFLKLVEDGVYDGGSFYRSGRGQRTEENPVPVRILQGGIRHKPQKTDLAPLEIEKAGETGLKHDYLTVSLVNEGDKAATEFFICMNPQPELDRGGALNPDGGKYLPFGKVISGEEVVHKVWGSPAMGELIDPLIIIHKIKKRK